MCIHSFILCVHFIITIKVKQLLTLCHFSMLIQKQFFEMCSHTHSYQFSYILDLLTHSMNVNHSAQFNQW